MTTNQTIDGVPRELEKAMSFYFGAKEVRNFKLYLRREFKPARSKTTARTIELSLGQVERAYDTAMVSGNRDLADELRRLLKAESAPGAESQVEPAAQHQGEPVCEVIAAERGARTLLWLADQLPNIGTKLYTEQPEPVADSTTSDKYKAELYDEVWQKARDMGFANVTDAMAKLGVPVAVVLPEPVGQVVEFGKGLKEVSWIKGKMPGLGSNLYTSARALLLPARRTADDFQSNNAQYDCADALADTWNACIDETERLNPGAKPHNPIPWHYDQFHNKVVSVDHLEGWGVALFNKSVIVEGEDQ